MFHQFCGLFSAGYVAIQLNQLFSWWEDDAGEAIPIDAATNYIALFALVLNGCFCGTFLVKMIVFLREVETSKTWKWLTSDASHPYHVWLVAGVVALFLDYAATLMFLLPRFPLLGAFSAFLWPTLAGAMYSGVRRCILNSTSVVDLISDTFKIQAECRQDAKSSALNPKRQGVRSLESTPLFQY